MQMKQAAAFSGVKKHFMEDHSDDEDFSIGSADAKFKAANSKIQKGILEIIKDTDEFEGPGRSSMDIQISEEVYLFLKKLELEFLAEDF